MSDKMKVLYCSHQPKYQHKWGTFLIREIPVRRNPYQEEKFGGMSLHNLATKRGNWRCTVCGRENAA